VLVTVTGVMRWASTGWAGTDKNAAARITTPRVGNNTFVNCFMIVFS
jgi:hypothetical protein